MRCLKLLKLSIGGDLVVGAKGFHPLLVVIGTLSDHLLAQDGNSDHLAKEMNDLVFFCRNRSIGPKIENFRRASAA
jgi:hypothetical protein